jgi:DNA-directed RNA polymerase specialized sigma24 family protein
MATRLAAGSFQSQLNLLSRLGAVGDLTDPQLLERCLSTREGENRAAFSALVERHGPMVLGVCRDLLGDSHDAEDAFQATVLVLLRKVGSVRNGDSLASRLHGVAFRLGMRAKADTYRRKAQEIRGAEMRARRNDCEACRPKSWSELHAEIARLPER